MAMQKAFCIAAQTPREKHPPLPGLRSSGGAHPEASSTTTSMPWPRSCRAAAKPAAPAPTATGPGGSLGAAAGPIIIGF